MSKPDDWDEDHAHDEEWEDDDEEDYPEPDLNYTKSEEDIERELQEEAQVYDDNTTLP